MDRAAGDHMRRRVLLRNQPVVDITDVAVFNRLHVMKPVAALQRSHLIAHQQLSVPPPIRASQQIGHRGINAQHRSQPQNFRKRLKKGARALANTTFGPRRGRRGLPAVDIKVAIGRIFNEPAQE